MKCEETRELLDAFHDDGELQPATLAAVETHLRTCPSCSAALAAHEALRAKVRSLARTPAPEQLAAKIRKSLTELDTEARSKAFGVHSWRAMAASHLLGHCAQRCGSIWPYAWPICPQLRHTGDHRRPRALADR